MVARWPGTAPRALVMHADPLSAYANRWFGGVLDRRAIDRLFTAHRRHLCRLTGARTLPIGVDFDPAARDEALLLGVGRLAPEKRWSLVCDAVAAAGVRRSVGLVIVGDGPERGALTRRIAGNPHIRLLPPVGRTDLAPTRSFMAARWRRPA